MAPYWKKCSQRALFVLLVFTVLCNHLRLYALPDTIFVAAATSDTEHHPIIQPPSSSIVDTADSPRADPAPPSPDELVSKPSLTLASTPSLHPAGSAADHSDTRVRPVPSTPSTTSFPSIHPPTGQNPVGTPKRLPVQSRPYPTSSPIPSSTRRRNRAAESLGLVHVPLKVSCEILRRFYNSTSGISWSNQDGWQYVDSAPNHPSKGNGTSFPRGPSVNKDRSHLVQVLSKRMRQTESKRWPMKRTPSDSKQDQDRDNDHEHDNEDRPDIAPPDHDRSSPRHPSGSPPKKPGGLPTSPGTTSDERRPISPPLTSGSNPNVIYPPSAVESDPTIGPAGNPAADLNPNNCCGWYGVVCIGPDGMLPPPWPPYDEDLIASKVAASGNSAALAGLLSGSDSEPNTVLSRPLSPPLSASAVALSRGSIVSGPSTPIAPTFGKRKMDSISPKRKRVAPYFNYHDRNQPHHGKDGKGHNGDMRQPKSPGRGSGGNQHAADDNNNERGRPSDPDEDARSNPVPRPVDDTESPSYGLPAHGNEDDPLHQPPTPLQQGSVIDDWYIVELHLGFNGLTGPVPEELTELENLLILDISNNELTGEIPESYGNLTRLKRFDISSNKITGTFPVAVTKMVNIQELVLKNNYLTGPLPGSVLKLKQMTELSIANNEFDGFLPRGLFDSLRKLQVVNINQNGFTGEIGPEVGGLTGLIKFSARANEFSGNIPKEFGYCKQLSSIDLGNNHFSGEIPETLYWLPNLKNVDFMDNKLSGRLTSKIGLMTSITRLILSHNSFSGPLPVEIQNLTRLEYMVVNYNHFDGLFPSAVAPPQMTVCLVQPNPFTACPSNASVETSTTLAYQCNLDCRDRIIHPGADEAISSAPYSWPRGQGGQMMVTMLWLSIMCEWRSAVTMVAVAVNLFLL